MCSGCRSREAHIKTLFSRLEELEQERDKLRVEVDALQRALYGRARGSKASLLPDVANALLTKRFGEEPNV